MRRPQIPEDIRLAPKGTMPNRVREMGYVFINYTWGRDNPWPEAQTYRAWSTQQGTVYAVHPDDLPRVRGLRITRLRDQRRVNAHWYTSRGPAEVA